LQGAQTCGDLKKDSVSFYCLLLCSVAIVAGGIFYYPKWNQKDSEATLSWDVSGYYMYLPAVFIYKDVRHCSFGQKILDKYHPTPDLQQVVPLVNGNVLMKYTMGEAIIQFPFFALAHCYCLATRQFPADGFSYPYQLGIGLGMLFCSIAGLYYLRKFLLHYFTDVSVAACLLCIALASNYLNYAAIDGAMVHNAIFTGYAVCLYLSARLNKKYRRADLVLFALVSGLILLIRPAEWGVFILPFFFRRDVLLRGFRRMALYLSCLATAFVPQVVYTWLVSGRPYVDTYPNDGFDWFHPHIWHCLFSYKAGWWVYSPVMVLCIAGFAFLYQVQHRLFYPSLIFFLVSADICFSWRVWWYGASLGQRALIDAYPVLAIPLAAAVQFLFKRVLTRIVFYIFLVSCITYNLWLTAGSHKNGVIKNGEMNKAYFLAVLGKAEVSDSVLSLLDNEENLRKSEKDLATAVYAGSDSMQVLNSGNTWSHEYRFLIDNKVGWIRAAVTVKMGEKEWDIWKMRQLVLKSYSMNSPLKASFIRIDRWIRAGKTGQIFICASVPSGATDIGISAWNPGSAQKLWLRLDSIKAGQ